MKRYDKKQRGLESLYDSSYASYNLENNPKKLQAHLAYLGALAEEIVQRTYLRNVLDVGCGTARFRPFFEKKGMKYFGVEISEAALEKTATSHSGTIGASHAEKLLFREGVFDCVLAHHVVEHLLEPSSVIAEFGRVVSPNGHVVVVTSVLPFGSPSLWHRIGLFRDKGHVSVFVRSRWKKLFEREGFRYLGDFQDIVATDPPSCRFPRALLDIPVIGDLAVRGLSRIIRGSYVFRKEVGRDERVCTSSKSIEFVCPSCYSRLILWQTLLKCSSCGNKYDVSRGFPNFKHELPDTMLG